MFIRSHCFKDMAIHMCHCVCTPCMQSQETDSHMAFWHVWQPCQCAGWWWCSALVAHPLYTTSGCSGIVDVWWVLPLPCLLMVSEHHLFYDWHEWAYPSKGTHSRKYKFDKFQTWVDQCPLCSLIFFPIESQLPSLYGTAKPPAPLPCNVAEKCQFTWM